MENDITMEQVFFPAAATGNGFGPYGDIGATSEFLDAFADKDGYPISVSTIYNPAKPFENREPRFYSYINYNTRTYIPARSILALFIPLKPGNLMTRDRTAEKTGPEQVTTSAPTSISRNSVTV